MSSSNRIRKGGPKGKEADIGSVFRAHLVTVWFLFGGFLAYQAFFTSRDLSDFVTVGTLLGIGLLLFCLPFIIVVCGTYFIVMLVQSHDNKSALISFAVMAAYFLLWRGVWCVLYGRRGRFARPTP